ncbi:DUF2752 domain-containing protein [Aurantibacter crassamenti]|uniref:DUF2752 domain-containing protein n=1 Tax=Aurantibacter crassamenti TaxID=1837375 RepID=UPI00193933EE|nr:DUF2752 domain-containing protein [Aurantibacter crassamenti]MBM1106659.1 DUF2752 domain-containing protein [Aurantibacter crassamenti]
MKIPIVQFLMSLEDYMLPCINKKIFGFECPGCGLQRSAMHLVKGEFAAAFEMYPPIYAMIILFGFIAVNKFFTVKYENQIIIGLIISTVSLILINYTLKFI